MAEPGRASLLVGLNGELSKELYNLNPEQQRRSMSRAGFIRISDESPVTLKGLGCDLLYVH